MTWKITCVLCGYGTPWTDHDAADSDMKSHMQTHPSPKAKPRNPYQWPKKKQSWLQGVIAFWVEYLRLGREYRATVRRLKARVKEMASYDLDR